MRVDEHMASRAEVRSDQLCWPLPGYSGFTGSELLVDVAVYVGTSGSVPGMADVDPAGDARHYRAARAGDGSMAR